MKMKVLLIHWICFLLVSSSLCYPSSVENEPSTSQNPGLFGYFGNLWRRPFWNKADAITKPTTSNFSRIHHVSRPTKTHTATEPSTLDQPAGIFGQVKHWVNVIKEKIPLMMQTSTATFLEPDFKKTPHAMIRKNSSVNSIGTLEAETKTGMNHSNTRFTNHSSVSLNNTSKNINRLAHTFTPLTETTVDDITGSIDSIPSEWDSSLLDTIESESRQELPSESPATAQATFTTLPATDDTRSIESTTETYPNLNLNQNTTPSVIEIFPHSISNSTAFQSTTETTTKSNWYFNSASNISFETEELEAYLNKHFPELLNTSTEESSATSVTLKDDILLQITTKKRSNVNKLTPYYFAFFSDDNFAINDSKREYRLPSTFSRIYSRRTRKHKKISKRRTKTTSGTTDLTISTTDWDSIFQC